MLELAKAIAFYKAYINKWNLSKLKHSLLFLKNSKTTTFMKALLDDLTTISKKIGVYEYRFGVTSEKMFSANAKLDLLDKDYTIKVTIQEWEKCYKDYRSKICQIESLLDSLISKILPQSESKQTQEIFPVKQQTFGERVRSQLANHVSTLQSYEASEEDRQNLIEIRLPLIKPLEPKYKNDITTTTYPLHFGVITKKINDSISTVPTYLPVQVKLQTNINEYKQNIVRLKNGQYLDGFSSITYQGIDYPLRNVSYELDAETNFWDNVTDAVENFFDATDIQGQFTLSFFVGSLDIDTINYKIKQNQSTSNSYNQFRFEPIDNDNEILVELVIPVKVKKFSVSNDVYWLPEAGNAINFEWIVDPYARFGCLGNKLYPITEFRAKHFANDYSSSKIYETSTTDHKLGKIAVDNIKISLESLEGVTVMEANPNSDADNIYKWDLFIKLVDRVYPLQIKSSLNESREALAKYKEGYFSSRARNVKRYLPFIPPIIWVNPPNSKEKAIKLVEDIALRFSRILGIPLSQKDWENVAYMGKPLDIEHIGYGKKAHIEYSKRLRLAATNGGWDDEAEEILYAIALRDMNPHYKMDKHNSLVKGTKLISNQNNDLESIEI